MKRVLVAGVLLAVMAVIAIWIGEGFSIAMGSTVFGVALGAVLAHVQDGSPIIRIAGFLIGFVLTFASFAVHALFFPLVTSGDMVTAFILIIVLTVIGALLHGKVPFWSMLLGVAALTGAYGAQFMAAPQNFASEGIAAAGSSLFLVALGFLGMMIAKLVPAQNNNRVEAIDSFDSTPEENAGADILTSTKG